MGGEAGQDRRQGPPREGPQGRVLRASRSGGEPREEAPRMPLLFPPLAPLLLAALTPSSLPPVNPSVILFRPAGGCVVKHGLPVQNAWRGRPHVFHPCRRAE